MKNSTFLVITTFIVACQATPSDCLQNEQELSFIGDSVGSYYRVCNDDGSWGQWSSTDYGVAVNTLRDGFDRTYIIEACVGPYECDGIRLHRESKCSNGDNLLPRCGTLPEGTFVPDIGQCECTSK